MKSSVLSFLVVQLSHPYVTTGKTIALTIWTFVGKMMSLLFNMLSRFVIVFLPRSKHFYLAIVTVHSDFGAQKIKSVTVSIFSPSICNEVMGLNAMMASGPITSWQTDGEKVEEVTNFIFWAPKSLWTVTAVMKLRRLLLGRKAITNQDNVLKSKDITLPTKVHIVKAMGFPVVMY